MIILAPLIKNFVFDNSRVFVADHQSYNFYSELKATPVLSDRTNLIFYRLDISQRPITTENDEERDKILDIFADDLSDTRDRFEEIRTYWHFNTDANATI